MVASGRVLVVLLRLIGAAELAGLAFVFAPLGWMDAVHDRLLGLGPLPDRPIVEYMARHLSAVYAIHGSVAVAVSFDLPRYRPLIRLLGWGHVGLGLALTGTDYSAGFHWAWAIGEGTIVGGCGGLLLVLGRDRTVGRRQHPVDEPVGS